MEVDRFVKLGVSSTRLGNSVGGKRLPHRHRSAGLKVDAMERQLEQRTAGRPLHDGSAFILDGDVIEGFH